MLGMSFPNPTNVVFEIDITNHTLEATHQAIVIAVANMCFWVQT